MILYPMLERNVQRKMRPIPLRPWRPNSFEQLQRRAPHKPLSKEEMVRTVSSVLHWTIGISIKNRRIPREQKYFRTQHLMPRCASGQYRNQSLAGGTLRWFNTRRDELNLFLLHASLLISCIYTTYTDRNIGILLQYHLILRIETKIEELISKKKKRTMSKNSNIANRILYDHKTKVPLWKWIPMRKIILLQ